MSERTDFDIWVSTLDTVELVAASAQELRFRVSDPTLDNAEPDLAIVFTGPRYYAGGMRFSDVRLRRVELPATFKNTTLQAFEFASREIRPTEGRPYQAEIQPDGTRRVLFGKEIEIERALIVAKELTVTIVKDTATAPPSARQNPST